LNILAPEPPELKSRKESILGLEIRALCVLLWKAFDELVLRSSIAIETSFYNRLRDDIDLLEARKRYYKNVITEIIRYATVVFALLI